MADIRVTGQLDNFQRADEDPLSVGGLYAQVSVELPLQLENKDNFCSGDLDTTGDHFSQSYWTPETFDGDMEIWAEVSGSADNQDAWHLAFFTNVGSGSSSVLDGYYCAWVNAVGDRAQIYRMDNGVSTLLIQVIDSFLPVSGDLIMFRIAGDDLEAWRSQDSGANWTLNTSVADTTYRSNLSLTLMLRGKTNNAPLYAGWGGGKETEFMPDIARRTFGSIR